MSIFISYSSKDLPYVQKMVDAIRANGEDVWFAVDSIKTGENYAESIVKAIEEVDAVVMLLSKNSVTSKHVKIELNLALDKDVKIYPVRLEDILPDSTMQYYFITSQWYDLFYENFDADLSIFINKTFPKKDVEPVEILAEPVVKIEVSHAEVEVLSSSLDIESQTPEEYGEKSFFETEEEFLKRHTDYGYVGVADFKLINSDYDIKLHEFALIVSEEIPVNGISIEPSEAKQLFKETNNRKIYQRYTLENNILVKSWFVIVNNLIYKLETSKKQKIEESQKRTDSFQVLFTWADKFKIPENIFPRDSFVLNGFGSLNLGNRGLTEVPKEIVTLTSLKELFLHKNQLTEVPKEIGNLKYLEKLSFAENQLISIPQEIGNLTLLKELSLYKNKLTEVPQEIGNFKFLEKLSFADNQLISIPQEMGKLTSLKELFLHKNQLTEVPKEIGNLKYLEKLNLADNQLKVIPQEIGGFISLKELYLHKNHLAEIPREIGNLTSLTVLLSWKNQITEIPHEIGNLTSLRELYLNDNKIVEVPQEIANLNSLVSLGLSRNQIQKIPKEIGDFSSLTRLDIYPNPLVGPLDVEIDNLLQRIKTGI